MSVSSTMARPPKSPSFIKIMIGCFRTSLHIPPAFKKHLSKLRGVSTLRGPNGGGWRVEVRHARGECFFKGGWDAFVADHAVAFGDLLVFLYDGSSGFDVKIYGKTGCEKAASPPHKKGAKVRNFACKFAKKSAAMAKGKRLGETGGCLLAMRDANGALEAALSFKTTHPSFITTAIKIRRYCYNMHIPLFVMRKLDLNINVSTVLCDPCGRRWPVKVSQWADGRVFLGKGLNSFFEGNTLRNGDVCVFEFLRGINVIQVHIFRVGETDNSAGVISKKNL